MAIEIRDAVKKPGSASQKQGAEFDS